MYLRSIHAYRSLRNALLLLVVVGILAPGTLLAQNESATTSVSVNESEQPRVEVAAPIYDFGTVKQGAIVQNPFVVKNVGKGSLEITRLHAACGCTAAEPAKKILLPNESTEIKVTFDTTGFQGQKTKLVRVYTNDPLQTSLVLTMRGTVQPDVLLEPQVVQFGEVHHGKPQITEARLLVEPGNDIKLLEIESRSPELKVTWEDTTEANRSGKKILFTLAPTAPVGPFRTRVVVKTSSEKNPVINIPVLASIEGDIQLSPSAVSFGLVTGPIDKPVYKTVMVTNRGDSRVAIRSVSTDSDAISAEYSTLEDGKRYAIKVGVTSKANGVVRGKVRIQTDHSEQPQRELSLPVYAIVKPNE